MRDNKFTLKYRGSEVELTTMEPEEFPLLPEAETEIATLPTEILKDGIKRTVIATADETSRPVFTGLYLVLNNGKMEIVGTDTHRLAVFSHVVESDATFTAIIPSKAADEIFRLVPDGTINIKQSGSLLSFEWGETRITTRTIEGQFPNYLQVVPKDFESRVYLNVEELRGIIGRASIMSEDQYKIIRLSSGSGRFEVSSTESQSGKLNERIEAEIEGKEIKAAVNSKFLLDALSTLESESVFVEFNGETRPVVFREEGYVHVVLPTRTN